MPKSFVSITIPGRPMAKQRPRVSRHGTYTPKTTAEAEKVLQLYMKQACPIPLEWPLELGVAFYFRRPNSWPKAEKEAVDDGDEPWYAGRPDLDNLLKLVKDAGNGILWLYDAQVVKIDAEKVYGPEGQTLVNVGTAPGEG